MLNAVDAAVIDLVTVRLLFAQLVIGPRRLAKVP
jgi:hypothetical protein